MKTTEKKAVTPAIVRRVGTAAMADGRTIQQLSRELGIRHGEVFDALVEFAARHAEEKFRIGRREGRLLSMPNLPQLRRAA